MKKQLILLLLLTVSIARAQITLTNPEAFKIGDIGTYINSSPSITKIGHAGPGQIWDYSFLDSNSLFTVRLVDPASTPYASFFTEANEVEKNSDSTYNYLKVSTDTNLVCGLYEPSIGVYTTAPYLAGVRPMSYHDSFFSAVAHQYSVSGDLFSGMAHIKITTDGYGTLKLPNGTFTNVLRQMLDNVSRDSDQSGTIYTSDIKTYIWFDANHKFSLLKIDSIAIRSGTYSNVSIDVKYLENQRLGIYSAKEPAKGLHIVNKQSELLVSADEAVANAIIQIIGTDGKVVMQRQISQMGASPVSVDINYLKTGIYIVKVCSSAQSGVIKFYKD